METNRVPGFPYPTIPIPILGYTLANALHMPMVCQSCMFRVSTVEFIPDSDGEIFYVSCVSQHCQAYLEMFVAMIKKEKEKRSCSARF